jgi:hypothetical protein
MTRDEGTVKCLFENVVGIKRFRREVILAPDLFQSAAVPGDHAVAATR